MTTAASPGCPAERQEKKADWLALTGIIVAAALLRAAPWLANYPLHRDEALYGAWSRLVASGRDPLLLTPWIDKPPLSIYAGAASIAAFRPSELALRLPGMLASILAVAATFGLARRAYGGAHGGAAGEKTACLAAGLLALSPFAILFAPTAFTDPWLMLWLVCAAWAALARRGLAAGLALGLAIASKQQGVLVAPLVIGLLLAPDFVALPATGQPTPRQRPHAVLRRALAAVLGFALVFGPLTYWDSLRWHNRPSFWDRSLATYGRLDLAAPVEWPGRASEWAAQLGYLFGLPVLSWLMLGLAVMAVMAAVRRRREREGQLDLIFGAYVAGYLVLHVIITFQPWDRYLLPLLPLVCLLAARGLARFGLTPSGGLVGAKPAKAPIPGSWQAFLRAVVVLLLAGALSYGAWLGVAGRIPVGSDHGAYAGIREVAAFVRRQPSEAIVYHQSLGWYFDFYLFDAPQERRWFDTGQKLADDAEQTVQQEPGRPQWLAVTDAEAGTIAAIGPLLALRGLALTAAAPVQRPDGSRSFAIYQIVPAAGKGGQ